MINPYTGKMDWEQIIQQALQSFMMMKFFKTMGKDKVRGQDIPGLEAMNLGTAGMNEGLINQQIQGMQPMGPPPGGGMAPPPMPGPGATGAPGPMGQLPPELLKMLMMLMQGGQM